MAVVVNGKPVLYICPYCVKGRFTADDGFEGAVKHIRENHQDGKRTGTRRGRPARRGGLEDEEKMELPSAEAFG
jgi:hypothetical protein